jgi:NAD(P)H-hydrate epimerase
MPDVPEIAIAKRFFTDTEIEVPAVTAEQMREVDRIAMEETGPNLFQMMENAGRNLALLALEVLGQGWDKAGIMVLAGGGGNGGGGICAARHLANRGMRVKLCLAEPDRLGEVPSFQRKVFQSTSGTEVEAAHVREEPADLILDALIGYGLKSAPRGSVAELIHWANETKAPILALDLPSGVNATTGETPGACIKPQWTMTLALPKTGLLPEHTGDLFLADIGIPAGTYRRMGLRYVAPFGHRFRVPLTYR